MFEDLVSADSTGPGVQIIRREDVVNAVNRLAPAGPNAGTDVLGSEAVDRILSNQTSAVQLAAQMKADVILTASITALQRSKRRLDDPSTGTHIDVDQWTLVTTYGLIDGVTGASLAAGTVQSDYAKRDTPELKVEVDAIDELLPQREIAALKRLDILRLRHDVLQKSKIGRQIGRPPCPCQTPSGSTAVT